MTDKTMKAAVLHAPGELPRYEDFPAPVAGDGEVVVKIRAAALKNIEKVMAAGDHYESHKAFPCVVGIDAVGELKDGTRVYTGGARAPYGMMAEYTVVPEAWAIPIPDSVDDATFASLPNAALSSWVPMLYRAGLKEGETVLVMGGTSVAGKLAIQIAKLLGAGRVVAAGRNEKTLATLGDFGADATISLSQPRADIIEAFRHEKEQSPFDVVVDYLWGAPTEALLHALIEEGEEGGGQRTRLVEIGASAGAEAAIPAEALRSSALEIYGSGGGSGITAEAINKTYEELLARAAEGKLRVDTEQVRLADIQDAWQRTDLSGTRLVVVP